MRNPVQFGGEESSVRKGSIHPEKIKGSHTDESAVGGELGPRYRLKLEANQKPNS